jgi:hypothetical protein
MLFHMKQVLPHSVSRLHLDAALQYRMPRSGAYTVSDLPRDRLCWIACERCGHAGAYRRETLLAPFGDMALPNVLIALTACERRGDYSRPCG